MQHEDASLRSFKRKINFRPGIQTVDTLARSAVSNLISEVDLKEIRMNLHNTGQTSARRDVQTGKRWPSFKNFRWIL